MEQDTDRLKKYVRDRMYVLSLNQKDVYRRGGPAEPTLRKVINKSEPVDDETLAKLERVLGWGPGSCKAIYLGGEPTLPKKQDDPGTIEQMRIDAMTIAQTQNAINRLQVRLGELLALNGELSVAATRSAIRAKIDDFLCRHPGKYVPFQFLLDENPGFRQLIAEGGEISVTDSEGRMLYLMDADEETVASINKLG